MAEDKSISMENKADHKSDQPCELSYQFIKQITKDYNKGLIVGSGAFGTVYKGICENEEEIAVKVLRNMTGIDNEEFQKEFENLRRLKHENVVELLGFCNEAEELLLEHNGSQIVAYKMHTALCFEYVRNGSLSKHIPDVGCSGLNWHMLYKIIKGICQGIEYLRHGLEFSVWHLDLKPGNILLDNNMIPKIADFGLSRLLGDENTRKTISSVGTGGYVPPEYIEHGLITKEFDIFSMGVIIAKLMAGTKDYFKIDSMSDKKFIKLVHDNWRRKLAETLTPRQLEVYSEQVKICIQIAVKCMSRHRPERPNIKSILTHLTETENLIGKLGLQIEQVSKVGMVLGRASTVGRWKALEVLDRLGSTMTNLNINSGFVSSSAKGNRISILAFEVANTIVKGSNLMRSLSTANIKHIKEVVLHSEGVQHLISKDMDELLEVAASDKREELEVFSKEVIRFGNLCKDPQWHNLDRYFEMLASERRTSQHYLNRDAEAVMQPLIVCAQYTAELYHELHALDRFEQDYRRKHQDHDGLGSKDHSLHILKRQNKHVHSLKKKSLWSKNLEEVIEKLVAIVQFLDLDIYDVFEYAVESEEPQEPMIRLGPAGLALHYANIINQIDTLVSRSRSISPNMRDNLYQGLPPTIKSVLRSKLHSSEIKEELMVSQIKAEMEKTLRWLVPIANNTTKASHGFGWVGEWANKGSELNCKLSGQMDLTRIETLYHAEKEKTEAYILELVVWLHHLISISRAANGDIRSPIKSPVRPPTQRGHTIRLQLPDQTNSSSPILTREDQDMLSGVKYRKSIPGISKSNSHSPTSGNGNRKDLLSVRRFSTLPVIDFEIDRRKALDLIDRLD